MATIPAGTIVSPQEIDVDTQYESDIVATSPSIAVYRFYGVTGNQYVIGCEIGDTQPAFTLDDSVLYIYKPSNTVITDATEDYYNDDDSGPLVEPYTYYLGYGSRVVINSAPETGWYTIVVARYGESF